tara:strand:+ start:127 stop:717 length:591 start_codon:yes stop_codon:yes gene_type:complete
MDEFAEFEQEILRDGGNSKDPLKDCLNLLKKDELNADYTISMEDTTYTPAKKCGLLALGVILIAIILPMLLGVQLIRFIIKLGPLWSTTRHIRSTCYVGFCHSILEYEYKNEQLVEAKITKLDNRSYVFIGSTDIGESSSASVFTLATGNNEYKDLWPLQSIKYNYQDVKDFCEISGVKLRISAEEGKRHKLEDIS